MTLTTPRWPGYSVLADQGPAPALIAQHGEEGLGGGGKGRDRGVQAPGRSAADERLQLVTGVEDRGEGDRRRGAVAGERVQQPLEGGGLRRLGDDQGLVAEDPAGA